MREGGATADTAHTPAIERIARVLAGFAASINADGVQTSAAETVDANWADHRDVAIAILRTLREPDPAIGSPEDAAAWTRMVEALSDRSEN